MMTLDLLCADAGAGAFLVRDKPADTTARNAANRLLSQAKTTPCLEITYTGGQWLLSGRGQLVLTGADMNWRLNGNPLATHTVHYLDGDYLLAGRAPGRGCRAYLALRADTLSGHPTDTRLATGTTLTATARAEAPFACDYPTAAAALPHPDDEPLPLPVTPAPEFDWLDASLRHYLFTTAWTVSRQSDRRGLRLPPAAPATLPPRLECELLSSPVLPGTLQWTPRGPILLGPDAQTVGGYPRLVIAKDFGTAFQVPVGGKIRFVR